MAAALIAALFSLPALAFDGSEVKLTIERVATPRRAVFDGVVRDQSGTPLPGVTVTVRNEATKSERTTVTDVKGAFSIAWLNDGIYRVAVTLDGFKPAEVEHLELKESEATHANVSMLVDISTRITMGAIKPN